MQAVVMAGGAGTRLRPLTTNRPKPMVPVVNRPVLEHVVNLLKKHKVKDITATLHYFSSVITDQFQDGSDFGVKMNYLVEEKPLGTAGGVKKAEQYLDKTFIVMSGDVLTDIDLSEALKFHRRKGAVATVVLTRVPNPVEYGIVIVNEEGRIKRFLEKPGWGEVFSDTINTGIYILEPEALKYVKPETEFDFSKNLFPILLKNKEPMFGYIADGYWCDIGNPIEYLQANQDVLQGIVKVSIPGTADDDVWVGESAEIEEGVEIRPPVLIGKNCRVRKGAIIGDFTTIGDGVIIDGEAAVKRSAVWNNTFIGPRAYLARCVVCEKCHVHESAALLEGAVVGDECVIRRGATVKSGIRIWPGKMIEAGAVVHMDLRWGMKWMSNLFGTNGITGLANIEIIPEFASKLGVAFGSFLGRGSKVVVGRDTHRVSRMIKRALIAGLTAAGVTVYNVRICPAPVTRYMVRCLGADAGVEVRIHEIDPRSVNIQFFDSNGMELNRSAEKKIEGIFFKEEFRRVLTDEVGDIIYPARIFDLYREDILKFLDVKNMRKAGLSMVIDCANGAGSLIAPTIFGELGCQVTTLNARLDEFIGPRTFEQTPPSISNLARVVKALDADLGIALDADADRVIFIDEKGNVISGDNSLTMISQEVVKERGGGKVVVPISTSRMINQVIEPLGGEVIRCRFGARPLLDAITSHQAAFGGEESGGFVLPDFQKGYDGMVAAAKIAEVLARDNIKLSSLHSGLPNFYMVKQSVPCPWEYRGKIMRSLIEEVRDRQIDTIDGIKVFYDSNWILMHPSSEEPVINLYAEAQSKKAADRLIEEYDEKIRGLIT